MERLVLPKMFQMVSAIHLKEREQQVIETLEIINVGYLVANDVITVNGKKLLRSGPLL